MPGVAVEQPVNPTGDPLMSPRSSLATTVLPLRVSTVFLIGDSSAQEGPGAVEHPGLASDALIELVFEPPVSRPPAMT